MLSEAPSMLITLREGNRQKEKAVAKLESIFRLRYRFGEMSEGGTENRSVHATFFRSRQALASGRPRLRGTAIRAMPRRPVQDSSFVVSLGILFHFLKT